MLSKYLERFPDLVKGKKCIELGAGTGIVGIAASLLGTELDDYFFVECNYRC